MKKPKTAAILYSDVQRKYFPTEEQYLTEKDAVKDAKVIAKYFSKLGIKPLLYSADARLPEKLRKVRPDMVLNLVGSVKGQEYLAASIPAVMELMEIPYTGAGILAESLSYNKFLVKKLLHQHGIPVPHYQLIVNSSDKLDSTLRFPLISKLNEIHGSVEITKDAISENEKHFRQRLKFLLKTYKQPVLVEEFIVGKEIACLIVESFKKKVYLAERIFNTKDKFVLATFDTQWKDKKNKLSHYEKFNDPVLTEYVKKAFDVTGMEDYGKFDVRLDASGRYYFIDSNSNPYFGPIELQSDIAMVLKMYGVTFPEILKRLIANTMQQYSNSS